MEVVAFGEVLIAEILQRREPLLPANQPFGKEIEAMFAA